MLVVTCCVLVEGRREVEATAERCLIVVLTTVVVGIAEVVVLFPMVLANVDKDVLNGVFVVGGVTNLSLGGTFV